MSYDIAYMWNLKKKRAQVNLLTKQKQNHRCREKNMVTKGDKLGEWD